MKYYIWIGIIVSVLMVGFKCTVNYGDNESFTFRVNYQESSNEK